MSQSTITLPGIFEYVLANQRRRGIARYSYGAFVQGEWLHATDGRMSVRMPAPAGWQNDAGARWPDAAAMWARYCVVGETADIPPTEPLWEVCPECRGGRRSSPTTCGFCEGEAGFWPYDQVDVGPLKLANYYLAALWKSGVRQIEVHSSPDARNAIEATRVAYFRVEQIEGVLAEMLEAPTKGSPRRVRSVQAGQR